MLFKALIPAGLLTYNNAGSIILILVKYIQIQEAQMSGILIRKAVGMMSERPGEFFKRVIPAAVIPLAGMIVIIVAYMLNLRAEVLEKLLNGAESPYAVMAAYDKWYETLAVISKGGLAVMAVCCVAAVLIGRKSPVAVILAIVFSLIGVLVSQIMSVTEDISGIRAKLQEDMAQIESSRLESAEVRLKRSEEKAALRGIYVEGQPELFTVYSGIGEDTGHGWDYFYIPDSLGFMPDGEGWYDENKSIEWNNENAEMYIVTYTTNFQVVISVEAK